MLSPVSNANAASQTQPSQSRATAGLASDFQTFLRMLTAQARYQDPLDPLDSSQYAAQLAQFSMVEQQTQTNALLSALSGGSGGAGMLSGWLGLDVRADVPVRYLGEDVIVEGAAHPLADRHVLVALDSEGQQVGQQTLDAFDGRAVWSAAGPEGAKLPFGSYTFEVAAYLNGRELSREPASSFLKVVEVQISGGETKLGLSDGGSVPVTSVLAARRSETEVF